LISQHLTTCHKVGRKNRKKKQKTNQTKDTKNKHWRECPGITMTEFYSMETIDISKSNQYDIKKKTKKTNQTKVTKINTGWLRMTLCPGITMIEFNSLVTGALCTC
jgi:hypothetical protein